MKQKIYCTTVNASIMRQTKKFKHTHTTYGADTETLVCAYLKLHVSSYSFLQFKGSYCSSVISVSIPRQCLISICGDSISPEELCRALVVEHSREVHQKAERVGVEPQAVKVAATAT